MHAGSNVRVRIPPPETRADEHAVRTTTLGHAVRSDRTGEFELVKLVQAGIKAEFARSAIAKRAKNYRMP